MRLCLFIVAVLIFYTVAQDSSTNPLLTVSYVAGSSDQSSGSSGDNGQATSAYLYAPNSISQDKKGIGNIYISDTQNNKIRFISKFGIISTIAGTGVTGFGGDGDSATNAKLYYPCAVSVDIQNNYYIADTYNNRIRYVSVSGDNHIIYTFAGTGSTSTFTSNGDGNAATSATLNRPAGIAINVDYTFLYISDGNSHIIRKIDLTTKIISTIAGTSVAGYSGDIGPAINAKLYFPKGLSVDTDNNLYVADYGNHVVRKIMTGNCIFPSSAPTYAPSLTDSVPTAPTTVMPTSTPTIICQSNYIYNIAGVGGVTSSTIRDGITGTSAHLNGPSGVTTDKFKNVYIADTINNRIRKVSVNYGNAISTIAGTSSTSGSSNGQQGTSTYLSYPCGISFDSRSEYQGLLIADTSYNRVLKLINAPSYSPTDKPTKIPTPIPTYIPSTIKPTFIPSFKPSAVPSSIPSFNPSSIPTELPTFAPTFTPTSMPSTTNPSFFPTESPSFAPSSVPSIIPTNSPTYTPTISPTNNPTSIPTFAPTFEPGEPTSEPSTGFPTFEPTFEPTTLPTNIPTCDPTILPTNNPTYTPTSIPTIIPTVIPSTASPTTSPTTIPTIEPTFSPSYNPTNTPTLVPSTTIPSEIPTITPTIEPTFNPTFLPSESVPTFLPSGSPTRIPTSQPTEMLQGSFSYFTVQFEVAYLNSSDFYKSASTIDTWKQSISSILDGINSNNVEIKSEVNHDYSYLPLSLRPPYISTDIETNIYFFNSYVGSGRRLFYSQYDYYIYTLKQSIYPYSDNFTDILQYFAHSLACQPLQNVSVVAFTIITEATPLSLSIAPSAPSTFGPATKVSNFTTYIIIASVCITVIIIGCLYGGYIRYIRRKGRKATGAYARWNETYANFSGSTRNFIQSVSQFGSNKSHHEQGEMIAAAAAASSSGTTNNPLQQKPKTKANRKKSLYYIPETGNNSGFNDDNQPHPTNISVRPSENIRPSLIYSHYSGRDKKDDKNPMYDL